MGACRELPAEYYAPKRRALPEAFLDEFVDLLIKCGKSHEVALIMAQARVNNALRSVGEGLYWVPKAFDYNKPYRQCRDSLILAKARQGYPVAVIAKNEGLSRAHVYRILARMRTVSPLPK